MWWEYEDPNKSKYGMYQTGEELVIKVSFGKYKPDAVNYVFGQGEVTITGDRRSFPVFRHAIPLDAGVDPEGAKATLRDDMWILVIPKKS